MVDFYTKCAINSVCAMGLSLTALAAATTASLIDERDTPMLFSCPAASVGMSVLQVGAATLLAKHSQNSYPAMALGGMGVYYAIDGLSTEASLGRNLTTLLTTYAASASVAALGAKLTSVTFDALKISNINQYKIGAGVILGSLAYFGTSLSLGAFPLACAALSALPLRV